MADHLRNAFGRLICTPDKLPHEQRVEELSRLAGGLLSGNPDPRSAQWLGEKLVAWLDRGGRLEKHLGVLPAPGSHRTAVNLVASRRRAELILRFANEVGRDQQALRILRGEDECPERAATTLMQLQAMGKLPKSKSAISRARRISSRPV